MDLQTKISLQVEEYNPIDYKSKVVLLGSCFVENIGEKLDYYKYQAFRNPFGILFHPLAIENLILNAVNGKVYSENDIFFHNEQWHCFDVHSKLSASSKDVLLKGLNNQIELTNKQLKEASHIIITLGTTWAYRHIESDAIVANCHKRMQKEFLKELLAVDVVSESLDIIVSLIRSINTKADIIFTVSPVRHLKDGFVENMQSKAHLITAVHQVVSPRHKLHYFPSYEIMMDELRDYRFYENDMLHPSSLAIDYIWNKFSAAWVSKEATVLMKEIGVIQSGLNHKPFNPNSEAHQDFLKQLEAKKLTVQNLHPHISF
ncbi:GSCFA domain-containing protein [Hanstruepera marina]|uniref:GSCFA domain-containing protein n=1 Tax=Hanstruepera marina TaxID=2873265 RepID=UPI001CA5FB8E|nr:GSCFA domain-containing protein [Hanstruepera marina]